MENPSAFFSLLGKVLPIQARGSTSNDAEPVNVTIEFAWLSRQAAVNLLHAKPRHLDNLPPEHCVSARTLTWYPKSPIDLFN